MAAQREQDVRRKHRVCGTDDWIRWDRSEEAATGKHEEPLTRSSIQTSFARDNPFAPLAIPD